jgi:hypothetical protein
MNRTALIEAMARAISDANGFPADERFNIGHQKFPNETMAYWENYTDEAAAALEAVAPAIRAEGRREGLEEAAKEARRAVLDEMVKLQQEIGDD